MISMVIPTYTKDEDLEDMAIECALSYRNFVDEMIITEDGQRLSFELAKIADIYIYTKENKGFTKNVNTGWKMASGDFVMIVNSDTMLYEGNPRDLCVPGKVTSPVIVNQVIPRLAGPFWCAPKDVTKKYGYLREEMKTYSSDSEYDNRVKDIFQKVETVKIHHKMARSVKAAGIEEGKEQERDRKIYAKLDTLKLG